MMKENNGQYENESGLSMQEAQNQEGQEQSQEESPREYSSEMERLLMEEEENYQEIYKGSIVKGVVMVEKNDSFYIDLSYKTEGVLPKDQILETEDVKVGDKIEVQVIKVDKNTGDITLSKKRLDEFKVWDDLKVDDIAPVKITAVNPKGLIATYKGTLRGFIPLSHIALKFVGEDGLHEYIGQAFDAQVIDIDPRKRRLIFSRKLILQKEQAKMREAIVDQIKEGAVFEGEIRDIKDYGIFVDIGGYTGLVHISEISWDRNENIRKKYKIHDKVTVKVISFDPNTDRLSLSMKALKEHPWNEFIREHQVNDILEGEVKNLKEYGAFISLYPTVDGFVHISNISSGFVKNPTEILKIGEKVRVRIISIDQENRKIELSMIIEEEQEQDQEEMASNYESDQQEVSVDEESSQN